jgi:hypothetical protein
MDKRNIKALIIKNKGLLKKNNVKSISLFGSYARGQQTSESDIDFLVEFKGSSYRNYINLVYSLENIFNKEITVVTLKGLSPYVKPYVLKEAEKIEGR